jgi:3-methyladenine DNA glycosylase/8-oxoguanine DNA glycosylase
VSERLLAAPERYDLGRTMGYLAVVPGDPTIVRDGVEAWWATRTPCGPGTLRLRRTGAAVAAAAFGPGAEWLLDRADAIAGLRDDVSGFDSSPHGLVRQLWRTFLGVRLPSSGRVFHHIVAAILGQKVTGKEAGAGYRRLLRHFASDPVPGPAPARLMLPPDPSAVAATPYWAFHPWGIEQKRADTVRRAAAFAARLDAAADAVTATRLMTSLPGVGVWTAAEVVRAAFGDGDAVSVGDYHHKNTVAWALAGEPRGTDERMLELLEPFRGHRGRVVSLLEMGGHRAPKFGPRMPVRSFARF